jgi:prevent-host-death family protein
MMEKIGTFEAKNRLSSLLDRVERGEEIMITKRGKAVAKLVPATEPLARDRGRQAMARIRARAHEAAQDIHTLAQEMNLGPFDWDEWKKYRDEGRE